MKHHVFTVLVLAAMLLSGCSGEDELTNISYPIDNVVHIAASVSTPQTRAGYSTENLSDFGLSINNPVSSKYTYNNVEVEKSGNDWIPNETVLWHNLTDTVDVVACAPYSSEAGNLCGVSNYKVFVDNIQSERGNGSDFLVFKKSAMIPSAGILNIQFKHAMSLLNITLEIGAQSSQYSIRHIKVSGTKINGVCDFTIEDPTVTATGEVSDILIPTLQNKGYCFLIPQTIEDKGLAIEVVAQEGTTLYKWISNQTVTFESGKIYQVKLKLP